MKEGIPADLELTDDVVLLRRWHPTDVEALTEIWQDDELQRRFGVEPPVTAESTAAYIEGVAARWRDGLQISLAVTADGTLVGGCDLDHLDTARPDLGYWTAAPARRQRHATRAGRLLLDWAAASLGVTEVCIEVERGNTPSIAIAERLGFVRAAGVERPRRSTPEEAPLAEPTKGGGVERTDGARSLQVYELTITPPTQGS